jgi:hypothetical protein
LVTVIESRGRYATVVWSFLCLFKFSQVPRS